MAADAADSAAPAFSLRPLLAADLPAVLAIQAAVYPAHYHEPPAAFLPRLAAFPAGHWVALDAAGAISGYCVAYPCLLAAARASPPSLSGDAARGVAAALAAPPAARAIFVHEVTLRARARRAGAGRALLAAALRAGAAAGARAALLVAVLGNGAVWRRLGFARARVLPWGYYAGRGGGGPPVVLRAARADEAERAALCEFVCAEHVAASAFDAASRAAQVADLRDDFPALHDAAAWAALPQPAAWVVEEADGTLVAAAGIAPSASRARAVDVSFLFVAPRARRAGLARALLRGALRAAAARGAEAARLLTLPGVYDAAIKLYEAEGFAPYRADESTPAGHYRLRWMERALAPPRARGEGGPDESAESEDLSAEVMEMEPLVVDAAGARA